MSWATVWGKHDDDKSATPVRWSSPAPADDDDAARVAAYSAIVSAVSRKLPDPLPVEDQVETIVGFKGARLLPETASFMGLGVAIDYRTTARSVCAESLHHVECPDPGCFCGFYVVDTAEALDRVAVEYFRHPGVLYVILTVDCWGRCIRHERGWRVENQRVLRVTVPRCARSIPEHLSKRKAELDRAISGLGWTPRGPGEEKMYHILRKEYGSLIKKRCDSPTVGARNGEWVCEEHFSGVNEVLEGYLAKYTLVDLADRYGTEFVSK